jgi:hypothetical protein
MEEDKKLKEAIEACAKIVHEKCGKRPFMIVISKADVKLVGAKDKAGKVLSGTANYMYLAKPPLRKDGLSKILIDTSRVAVNAAEKKILEEAPG